MPTYEYRCASCQRVTALTCSIAESPKSVACEACGEQASKIISSVAVRLSNLSKMEKLDPKYDKMVDQAMSNSSSADPDNYIKRMKPYSK